MTWAVPRVRTVLRIVNECPEKRRREAVGIRFRFPDNVSGDELGRVFKHMDEAVQFAQNIIGNVGGGARLTVEINRNFGVTPTDLFDERTQIDDGGIKFGARCEFFVIDRKNECGCAALLLSKLGQVAVAGDPQYFHSLAFDGIGQCANSQTGRILGPKILVDDDDWKSEFHCVSISRALPRLGTES